jgi:hypothetical protein
VKLSNRSRPCPPLKSSFAGFRFPPESTASGDERIDAVIVLRVTAAHADGTFDCSYAQTFTADPAVNLEP